MQKLNENMHRRRFARRWRLQQLQLHEVETAKFKNKSKRGKNNKNEGKFSHSGRTATIKRNEKKSKTVKDSSNNNNNNKEHTPISAKP